MRDIKFRVWDKHDKVMKSPRTIEQLCWIDISSVVTEDYIFEQFTGLTDKNGVEIFEGDIVDQITTPVAVYFAHGAFLMHAEYHQSQFVADHANRLTVIGNIHEHSDLLKGEQQ